MKILKVKAIVCGFLTVLAVSVFLTSCEQDAIIDHAQDTTIDHVQDDLQTLIAAIDQDADVASYSAAAKLFESTLNERVVANQEQFDSYLAAGMEKEIDELLDRESMAGLIRDMQEKYEVVLAKYPDIASVNNTAIAEYYSNNITARGCSWVYYVCIGNCAYALPWMPIYVYYMCIKKCEDDFC